MVTLFIFIGNVYQINWIFIRIFEWKINNDVNIHKSWNKKKIWMEKQTKWFTEQQFSCHKSFEALPTVWRTEVFFRKRNLYQTNQQSLSLKSKEGGDIGLFITLVPKVYKTFFLFVGSTTLVTFIEFWLVCSWSWVFKRFHY